MERNIGIAIGEDEKKGSSFSNTLNRSFADHHCLNMIHVYSPWLEGAATPYVPFSSCLVEFVTPSSLGLCGSTT